MADRIAAVGYAIFEGPHIIKMFESETQVNMLAIFPTYAEAESVLNNIYAEAKSRYKIFKVEI